MCPLGGDLAIAISEPLVCISKLQVNYPTIVWSREKDALGATKRKKLEAAKKTHLRIPARVHREADFEAY